MFKSLTYRYVCTPHNKICSRASFKRLVYPSGCNKEETSARRSLRDSSQEGQGGGAEQGKMFHILNTIVELGTLGL